MNLNQLKAFASVIEAGSFSAAARRLGLSQPAVSLQIQSLEEFLGVMLLDRSSKKVVLTEAGSLFRPFAVDILRKLEEAQRRIQELGGVVRGRLAVGGSTTPGQYVLPKLLSLFKSEYPDVLLTLRIADTDEIEEAVMAGELTAGLVGAKPKTQLKSRVFAKDEIVAIVPAKGWSGGLDLQRVKEEPFILREKGSGTRKHIEDFFSKAGVRLDDLNVAMELGSTEAVVKAVAAGLGISMVSKWAAEDALKLGAVEVAPLEGTPIVRNIYLVIGKRAPSRTAEAFLKFLEGIDIERIRP